ncbi:MAG: hypothetical protein ACRDIU_04795 [Actinomycetota bacterium]
MKVIFFCSAGKADAVRASMPFHLGVNGAVENGDEVAFILGGDSADILVGEAAEAVEGLGLPPLRELLEKVKKHSLAVYV